MYVNTNLNSGWINISTMIVQYRNNTRSGLYLGMQNFTEEDFYEDYKNTYSFNARRVNYMVYCVYDYAVLSIGNFPHEDIYIHEEPFGIYIYIRKEYTYQICSLNSVENPFDDFINKYYYKIRNPQI